VRHYPKPWRERYADEMLALLDDTPARWRDLVDVAYGLIVERAQSVFEPGDRPILTFAMLLIVPTVMGLALVFPAVGLGIVARVEFGALPRWAEPLGILISYLSMLLSYVRLLKSQVFDAERELVVWKDGATLPWWGTAVTLAGTVIVSWSRRQVEITNFLPIAVYVGTWLVMGDRSNRMTVAIRELFSLARKRKWARMEVERCQRLVAAGNWAPLAAAKSALLRIETRQEAARASLHALGYRARFRERHSH
jgi:hypothetical protein